MGSDGERQIGSIGLGSATLAKVPVCVLKCSYGKVTIVGSDGERQIGSIGLGSATLAKVPVCLLKCSYGKVKQKVSSSVLQQLVMSGIQVHIDSPIETVRHVGMATGECLMNRLNPSTSHKLKFEYDPSEEVKTLLSLARYRLSS